MKTVYKKNNHSDKENKAEHMSCLTEDVRIIFIGLTGYGVKPHERKTRETSSIIAELRRSLSWRKTKTHDWRPWRNHGVRCLEPDGLNTFNLLRKIVYDKSIGKMVIVLVGAKGNKFWPAVKDADPDRVLVIRTGRPLIFGPTKYEKWYGSDVFKRACDFVELNYDIWLVP